MAASLAVASAALPPAGWAQHEAPGASGWGEAKADQARLLAAWIEEQRAELPVIVGLDANAPRTDPPSWPAMTWWWDDEALLLGQAARLDVYRRWLEDNPDEVGRIAALRPDGPLVCTYLRGRVTKVPCRYDHILGAGVRVRSVGHVIGEAFAAGSDHALVHADLDLNHE